MPHYNPDETPSLMAGELPFTSRRSDVLGIGGMVATSQVLATQAGLDILKLGGNAADAAVAAAAVLNVTEPCSTGIGGDAFVLYFDSSTQQVKGLNGSGRSPANLTLDRVLLDHPGIDEIPRSSPHSITIPGACAAMCDTIQKFGSGKLDLKCIFKRAIQLAEDGYPISEITAYSWQKAEKFLKSASENWKEMLPSGNAPKFGEIVQLPYLASTYRTISEQGASGFYQGPIAQKIIDIIQSHGGVMTLSDLSNHRTESIEPLNMDFKDIRLFECPPNGQGVIALMALGILKQLEKDEKIDKLTEMNKSSAEYVHILVECLRLAFEVANQHVSDPEFSKVKGEDLINESYLASLSHQFDNTKTKVSIQTGSPKNSSDTVYLTCVDGNGNACSFIMSNYSGFGSGKVPYQTGFTLQNRGSGFSLDPNSTNVLAGNKRPYHTIIPAMVTKNKDLFLSYGVMGGYMQPQGHVQILLNLLTNLSPQQSLDMPRFCIAPQKGGRGVIYLEPEYPQETVDKLKEMGHDVVVLNGHQRAMFGRGQIIMSTKDKKTNKNVLMAGSDPRADGQAAGY